MNATIVIYGSSTGTCEAIAEKIASKLGCEALNVQDLTADIVAANQNLILGTSTWGAGELQDDWYDGLKTLQGADLSGKTIALFGCGDCSSYSDTFVGGMGELYNGIKDSGAKFIGSVETDWSAPRRHQRGRQDRHPHRGLARRHHPRIVITGIKS